MAIYVVSYPFVPISHFIIDYTKVSSSFVGHFPNITQQMKSVRSTPLLRNLWSMYQISMYLHFSMMKASKFSNKRLHNVKLQINTASKPRKVSYWHLHYVFIAHLVLNEIISACSKHWILIVLIPKRSLAYYIDSLKQSSKPLDLSFIQGFLSRYWRYMLFHILLYPSPIL